MSAIEESSLWTEVRPSNRHERVSEVRERVIQEGLEIFDRADFIIGRRIAKGGQGNIYEASSQLDHFFSKPRSTVVKKFKPLIGISQGHFPPQLWTRKWLNICKPIGVFFDEDDSLCVVMPRYSSDLRTLIDSRHNEERAPFPEEIAVGIIARLALGFKALHGYGIYHRDIKAANILVEMLPNVVIADFENSDDVVGTGFWRAPEILQTLHMFSEDRAPLSGKQLQAADVYGFGMTCCEILTGKTPFDGHRWSEYNLVLSGGRPELPDHVPEPLKNLIRACWHQDPDSRPSFADIVILLKEAGYLSDKFEFWQDMQTSQGEATDKWLDAPPEACLVELKRTLFTPEELHSKGLDCFPGAANLEALIAKFISTCEEFALKFGWDSQRSLPFGEFVERTRLVVLILHQLGHADEALSATREKLVLHLQRLPGLSYYQLHVRHLFQLMQRLYLMSRVGMCLGEGGEQSRLSECELTLIDKFAIVQGLIKSLLDAGVTKGATLGAISGIDDQLDGLEMTSYPKNYEKVRLEYWLRWRSMILFHPFHNLVKFLDTLFSYNFSLYSYKTILLCVVYMIPGCSNLAVAYLALRVAGLYSFIRCFCVMKCFEWIGLFIWSILYGLLFMVGSSIARNI